MSVYKLRGRYYYFSTPSGKLFLGTWRRPHWGNIERALGAIDAKIAVLLEKRRRLLSAFRQHVDPKVGEALRELGGLAVDQLSPYCQVGVYAEFEELPYLLIVAQPYREGARGEDR